ncbi:MAG: hypothetical protein QWI73_06475 [Alphaproteobacteria bacterium]|nr:hypothetical protein [Alphaproteobacteria bacterium]
METNIKTDNHNHIFEIAEILAAAIIRQVKIPSIRLKNTSLYDDKGHTTATKKYE